MFDQKYEDLTFTDDFAFCKIMSSDEKLCKDITELIIGKKVKEIIKIEGQKTIRETSNGKGVRFDVYFEDEDSIYDIEMQTSNQGDLPQRTRYYHSMSDLSTLSSGASYKKLKNSHVIFICTFDPFGRGEYKYAARRQIVGFPDIPFDDRMETVFISSKNIKDSTPQNMRNFLTYLEIKRPSDELTERIDHSLRKLLSDMERRSEYMTFAEYEEMAREEGLARGLEEGLAKGHAEGLEKGRAEGRAEGHAEGHAEGLAEGRASERLETIKKLSRILSVEELLELGYTKKEIEQNK